MSLPPVSDYKALYEYLVEIGLCPPLPVQRTDADPTSWEANDYMSNAPSCQVNLMPIYVIQAIDFPFIRI